MKIQKKKDSLSTALFPHDIYYYTFGAFSADTTAFSRFSSSILSSLERSFLRLCKSLSRVDLLSMDTHLTFRNLVNRDSVEGQCKRNVVIAV